MRRMARRTVGPGGLVEVVGLKRRPLSDIYHFLLNSQWRYLLILLVLAYVAVNCFFALLYRLGGECIENARPGSFSDLFFFSVQTMATIGYGKMSPITPY